MLRQCLPEIAPIVFGISGPPWGWIGRVRLPVPARSRPERSTGTGMSPNILARHACRGFEPGGSHMGPGKKRLKGTLQQRGTPGEF